MCERGISNAPRPAANASRVHRRPQRKCEAARTKAEEELRAATRRLLEHRDGYITRHSLAKTKLCHVDAPNDACGSHARRDASEARVDDLQQVTLLRAVQRHHLRSGAQRGGRW